ncbi:MAG: radical SAM protein [Chloroflexi bacterium]|nr:radical SAM protein [Chloroflexota bacterium]
MQLDLSLCDDREVHVRLSEALTLSFGPDLVYTLDLSGRPLGTFRRGRHLRWGLDGRVLARWRQGNGPRQRAWLAQDEIDRAIDALVGDLQRISDALLPRPIELIVRRALSFDRVADAEKFARIYRPVSILPPDQYQALVLQAAEGCSFNTCTFCALYRDRHFRIKPVSEFASHIEQVKDFFGEGLQLRRSVFLADANALVIPQERLLPLFDEIAKAFAIMPCELPANQQRPWLRSQADAISGVYAFVDGLSAERKRVEQFQDLRRRGLRRVYIGLESGHEDLLAWLQKPSTAAAMLDAVKRMKQAELQIGVIVLTGIGGERFHQAHCRDSAAVLNAMPLDSDDIIYFSPFQPDASAPYLAQAKAQGIQPPTQALIDRQLTAIKQALELPPPPLGPKRVPYNLHDFVY